MVLTCTSANVINRVMNMMKGMYIECAIVCGRQSHIKTRFLPVGCLGPAGNAINLTDGER